MESILGRWRNPRPYSYSSDALWTGSCRSMGARVRLVLHFFCSRFSARPGPGCRRLWSSKPVLFVSPVLLLLSLSACCVSLWLPFCLSPSPSPPSNTYLSRLPFCLPTPPSPIYLYMYFYIGVYLIVSLSLGLSPAVHPLCSQQAAHVRGQRRGCGGVASLPLPRARDATPSSFLGREAKTKPRKCLNLAIVRFVMQRVDSSVPFLWG